MNKAQLLLALPVLALAQQDPQLVWQGNVDGTSVIHVRGDRLDVEERQGGPVQRDRYRFYRPLPALRQDVQLQVLQSRGNVRVVRQPRPDNNFTLSVLIEDSLPGFGAYSLAFFWGAGSRSDGFDAPVTRRSYSSRRSARRGEETLTWIGRVDDEVIVECRGQDCRTQQLRGGAVTRDRYSFSRPLPSRDVRVMLDNVEGRGTVDVVEHPSSQNDYTARVRIRDNEGGADDYSFSLFWTPPASNESERLFSRKGMTWAGRVDGTIRVILTGTSASSEVVAGAPVQGEQFSFEQPLPSRSAPNAAVRKLRGRGRVEIVEFPSSRNSHRLVFEVRDSSGGADNYVVEVGW
jgi:hypothetical protein